MQLPIDPILPDVAAALDSVGVAVLQADPGAGKTTRVPLHLLKSGTPGRIVMLEPRRLAARAAAERMAETLGEPVGQTVGYAMRGARKVSEATRIEVITEGLLTRRIQADPELSGISTLIFDEFHERSLHADLGLALALEVRAALRGDLRLLVMSATLDVGGVAALLGDAPVIQSEGRSFPVEVRHLPKPWAQPRQRGPRFEDAMAGLIRQAVAETQGSLLAFLPGEGEIRRVESALSDLPDLDMRPLYGALPFAEQRRAIAPGPRRKLVLATAIAETSLTIEGVRVVIDGGRARRARFDAGAGMARLVTDRATKAEATQRQGRAGRTESGVCYKLWTKGEEGGMSAFPLPEILSADLAPLVLECAAWGANAADMPFLDPPRAADVTAAQELLQMLGALDANGRITDHGRAVLSQPTHPRLAHMLSKGGAGAQDLAALLEARDPLPRSAPADLSLRLLALRDQQSYQNRHPWQASVPTLKAIRAEAQRLRTSGPTLSDAERLALAYPDRIGLRRPGEAPRFVLSGGKGAVFDDSDPMGANRMVVVADLDGDTREARVRRALPITEAEVKALFPHLIQEADRIEWSHRHRRVEARRDTRLGALVLASKNLKGADPSKMAAAMGDGVADLGLDALPWTDAARFFQARVQLLQGAEMSDLSNAALADTLEIWLVPHLGGMRTPEDLRQLDMFAILRGLLSWDQQQMLDALAPAAIKAPTGTRLPVDYRSDPPKVAVRLQELFGMTTHPTVGPNRTPLLLELLSPARRPVQMTADLPGFWASSYADVRKDMRGRYPKHAWPEDPTSAQPTTRTKKRS
ncbi:MAG: ATP-dependent helicase HrpB [Pseudomonadota bacterium]